MFRLPGLTLAALAAFALAAPTLAAEPTAPPLQPGEWPQARSDLKADPNIRFGSLPNGMRYAILRNATPPGQASLRLRFDVGSLMERDDQQGLAHFLEHMAFNGSKNVPGRGEMVKTLERLGLAFGADTNAGTGFDNTTYKFDLPKADDASLDTALMLMREIAGNLTLDQGAMDKERGVILSEERLRDSPGYRITKAEIGFAMDGQRPPERWPIGLVPVIENAKVDLLADIYHHYYRPERATLVVVGDFDPGAMEAKIKARFSDWQGQGPAGTDPDLGKVRERAAAYRLAIEPGAQATVQLGWVGPPDLSVDNLAKRRREVIDQLALAVLNRRLGAIARSQDPPFISAGAFHEEELRAEEITGVIVNVQPGQWRQGLTSAETEVHRAVEYGVRPDELVREVTEMRESLKLAAAGAATRPTPALANEIIGTRDDDSVETSPADDLAYFEAITKDLQPETVSADMKELFKGDGPLVFMSSPEPVDGGEAALQGAFQTAAAAPVAPPEAPHQVDWPYLTFGTPSQVVDRKDITDLDAVFVRFGNGVRLTVKPTKFREDQVLVQVRFGQGLESLPADQQSVTWARSAITEGGLKQIDAEDTERALAGKVYGADIGVEPDAFVLSGATRPSDLDTQLQVLTAYLTDGGWRPEGFARLKSYGETLETQMQATDSGVMSRDLDGLLHGGDKRWTFPSTADIAGEKLDQLKAEFAPAMASGPVEVVMVGDITVDKAIEAVRQTLGAIPDRPDPAAPSDPPRSPNFPAALAQPLVETHSGRADQGIAFVAWPTDGYFADPDNARTNEILGRVLKLRLIDELRLKEGVTYSPGAGSTASTVWPHYGYVSAEMEAPPEKLAGFFTDVDAIAADLAAKPVSDDELERAKQPALEGLDKAVHTNEYWLSSLSGAQADPRRLDIIRSAEAGLERVTAADVQRAAAAELRPMSAWRLEIEPASPAAAASPASVASPAAASPAGH
ncbi:MAG TPA: insulinase family protein [Caulobacteraceae bacterium]|nr:insulinase family protein [Caulobacteraceae bacterium]